MKFVDFLNESNQIDENEEYNNIFTISEEIEHDGDFESLLESISNISEIPRTFKNALKETGKDAKYPFGFGANSQINIDNSEKFNNHKDFLKAAKASFRNKDVLGTFIEINGKLEYLIFGKTKKFYDKSGKVIYNYGHDTLTMPQYGKLIIDTIGLDRFGKDKFALINILIDKEAKTISKKRKTANGKLDLQVRAVKDSPLTYAENKRVVKQFLEKHINKPLDAIKKAVNDKDISKRLDDLIKNEIVVYKNRDEDYKGKANIRKKLKEIYDDIDAIDKDLRRELHTEFEHFADALLNFYLAEDGDLYNSPTRSKYDSEHKLTTRAKKIKGKWWD